MEITIKVSIEAPIRTVWNCWTNIDDIKNWNLASPDWCCPRAENELKVGGKFKYRMEAKDGSMGFDFSGTYTKVEDCECIEYELDDERKVQIYFEASDGKCTITETFDAEDIHTGEQQRQGWQSILNNFKSHVESKE